MLRTSQDLAGREKVTRDGRGRRWWCQCWAVASTLRKMGRLSVWAGLPSSVYLPVCLCSPVCTFLCVPLCPCVNSQADTQHQVGLGGQGHVQAPFRGQRQRFSFTTKNPKTKTKKKPRDSVPFLQASKRQTIIWTFVIVQMCKVCKISSFRQKSVCKFQN